MSHDAEVARPGRRASPGEQRAVEDSARLTVREALAGLAGRAPPKPDTPTPDLLTVFDEQLASTASQHPGARPSPDGTRQLDELARIRFRYLRRQVALETAERVAAMICRLLQSATPVVAIALLGRQVGAW